MATLGEAKILGGGRGDSLARPADRPSGPRGHFLWCVHAHRPGCGLDLRVDFGLFRRRSLDSIATHLNVRTFATAGLIYLIGAALLIVFVGFLLVRLIAPILMIVAFLSIQGQQLAAGVAQPPSA